MKILNLAGLAFGASVALTTVAWPPAGAQDITIARRRPDDRRRSHVRHVR